MNGLTLLGIASAAFLCGYFIYSRFLGKVLGIDPSRKTPAVVKRDGVDYVPAHPTVLFGHHFAAIAGAGPIVGPVLAAQFGWASVALWIILGCIFIGAAHDMIALFLSVRNNGESIGTVIGSVLGRPGRIMFLLFSWSALILVVAEFTRQIAATFVLQPAIASASMLFIAEAVLFGLFVYRFKVSVLVSSLIFVPLMFAFVWIGGLIPIDLLKLFGTTASDYMSAASNGTLTSQMIAAKANVEMIWTLVLLVYCFFASTLPVWLLLQPRDYLNAYLLYAMMLLGFLGVIFTRPELHTEAFTGFTACAPNGDLQILFPFLFVTVACGACSGFHALVAGGTTSKQLDNERSIRPVAYGGMLLEGVLAILALVGVAGTYMSQSEYQAAIKTISPVQMFATTTAGFCASIGIPRAVAEGFMLLAVSAFLMTSVDAATRLARFSFQELTAAFAGGDSESGAKNGVKRVFSNMYVGTGLVVALVAALLLGNPAAAKQLWNVFASANQLLAALTLLTTAMWFIRNGKIKWCWITAVPMCLMMGASGTALVLLVQSSFASGKFILTGACSALLALAVALVFIAVARFISPRRE
jgi:carbon starvation protein